MIGATILLSMMLAQNQPASASASSIEKAQSDNRLMMQQEFSVLPHRGPLPINKIIRVTLEGGHIHVIPLLPPTDGFIQCDAIGWPGHLEISLGASDSLILHLKEISLSDNDTTMTMTDISTMPDYLQINRMVQTLTTLTNITLIQSRQFEDDDHNPTRLTVQETREDIASEPPQTKLADESFAKLRQQHPAEMRAYMLPILRDLGAASLLHLSDSVAAWQVLGTSIPIDPALDHKLDEVLKHLDADDFATRAKAEEELTDLGPPGAAVLQKRDLDRLSPDPRAAVDNFLHREHPLSAADAQASANSPAFLLDTALLDDPGLRQAACEQLQKVTGHPLDIADVKDPAVREKRIEAYRDQYVHDPTTQP